MIIGVKLQFNNETKRVNIDSSLSFATLQETVKRLFNPQEEVTIYYKGIILLTYHSFSYIYLDEDGDRVTLTSDMEVREAINFATAKTNSTLNLTITSKQMASLT
jgi:hypothetical protein